MTSLDPRAPFALAAAGAALTEYPLEPGQVLVGDPTLEVGPGSVAVPPEGAVTRQTVHETLRKVYQTSGCAPAAG